MVSSCVCIPGRGRSKGVMHRDVMREHHMVRRSTIVEHLGPCELGYKYKYFIIIQHTTLCPNLGHINGTDRLPIMIL